MVFGKMPARKTLYHQRQTSGIVAKNKASGRDASELGTTHQTKFHFRRHLDPEKNKQLCSLRNYLKRKGYEIPGRAGMAVYVTRETRRSAKMESKAEKLGMIIKIAA